MKPKNDTYQRDVFISYATPNREIALVLASLLEEAGIKTWIDKWELRAGDQLVKSLNEALRSSQVGVVILSHDFFARDWPQKELDALYHLFVADEKRRIIPIWYGLSAKDVGLYAPLYAGLIAINWNDDNPATVVTQILAALDPHYDAQERSVSQAIAKLRLALEYEDYEKRIQEINDIEKFHVELGEFLRQLVVNRKSSKVIRIRGLHLLLAQYQEQRDTLHSILQESDDDFMGMVIDFFKEHPQYMLTEQEIAVLFQNKNLPRRATGIGKLIAEYIRLGAPYTSEILCYAGKHPHWAIRSECIRAIITIDDADSINALGCFVNTTYWRARRNIADYLYRRAEDNTLTEHERDQGVQILQHMLLDGESSESTSKYLKKALYALKGDHSEFVTMSNNPISVLFLASEPVDLSHLNLGEEFRSILQQIERAKLRDKFKFEIRPAIRVSDLTHALLAIHPEIVHFSGHGSQKGIILEDVNGNAHTVPANTLATLFAEFSPTMKCVLLNACYSSEYATKLGKSIPYVITINNTISNDAAIAFSVGFYQALGAGTSIEHAYRLGCIQIDLLGYREGNKPKLWKNGSEFHT